VSLPVVSPIPDHGPPGGLDHLVLAVGDLDGAAADYVDLIESRFANPRIVDTTRRVAFDGSARHTGFLLPIIRDQLAAGRSVEGLALVEALWARMCAGIRENGTEIAANDPIWDDLKAAGNAARARPEAWLEQAQIYGDLGQEPRFSSAFSRWLAQIWREGSTAALAAYAKAG